ncbi:MAG: carbohydrate-binding family 9-like protein [Terracidiphilus sp.]
MTDGKTGAEGRGAHDVRQSSVNREHSVIVSKFSAVDIVPDGNLEKEFWTGTNRIRFDEAGFSRTRHPEARTLLASRWTRQYLYLAFWCHYQNLNTYEGEDAGPERWQLWEKDVVEAFINPTPNRPSHYYEFEVAPNNQWLDLEIDLTQHPFGNPKWNSGFLHETRIDAQRHVWTVEMRIPIVSMAAAAAHPITEWKVNFYRCDGAESGTSRRMLSWGALPLNLPENSFHQPDSFGILRFIPGS